MNKVRLKSFNVIKNITFVNQLFGISIILIASIQVYFLSHYNTALLAISITSSYALSIIIILIVSIKFLNWFKSNKSKKSLLVYSIATSSISINLFITLFFVLSVVHSWNSISPTFLGTTSLYIISGSLSDNLIFFQNITLIISFSLTWYATLTILFNRIWKINKLFLLILFIPLFYFLIQYISIIYDLFSPLIVENPYQYSSWLTILFTLSQPVGGILFGIAFWIMSKNIPKKYPAREFLITSTFGFIILFISNQAVLLTSTPFPPYGLISVSTLGFSTFLIYMGIYLSAISISKDAKLRNIIKRIALQYNVGLLENIGSAQIINEIEEKAFALLDNKKYNEDNNEKIVKSDIGEMKHYINEILVEIKEEKLKKDNL
jgi:hypothetical protein